MFWRLLSALLILWLIFSLQKIVSINISSYIYREKPITIPIKAFYKKKNIKPSNKGSEATQQNPSISRHLLRKQILFHKME